MFFGIKKYDIIHLVLRGDNMEKACKKCGNNLYGNKVKCPFCGTSIKGSSTSFNGPNNNYSCISHYRNLKNKD